MVQLLSYAGCPLPQTGVFQQQGDFAGCQFGRVTAAPNHASYAQATNAAGVIRLIVAIGHYQHWFTGAQCLRSCAYAALVDDDRSAREKSGIGRVVSDAHILRNLLRDVAWVAPHQQHGTLARQASSQRALLVEVACIENSG